MEREIIHGRWAMLGVTGAWAQENGTGIPWFKAAEYCQPDDCTARDLNRKALERTSMQFDIFSFPTSLQAIADKFPGAIAPLAPEGSGFPNYWNVLAIEVVLMGLVRATYEKKKKDLYITRPR